MTLYGETLSIAEWVDRHQLNIYEVHERLLKGVHPFGVLRPPAWLVACGKAPRGTRAWPDDEDLPERFPVPDFSLPTEGDRYPFQ